MIFQIYPRSFQDTTGNGIGDLEGILTRIDYLAETLGVDAIWISPFYPSPMADFGYDVADYTDVDPLFGDLRMFDKLVEALHQRGLKLIIDWVPNHTSEQHPWFVESRSSLTNPKRDWYIWRPPREDGSPPNNWIALFGGPAWEHDEATGEYYNHTFLKEQPELNWRNPQVREAMCDTLRFWLERGVDGFRMDVIHMILKDPELKDNPANPAPEHWFNSEYESQLHIHDKMHPDIHEAYREIRAVLEEFSVDRPRVSIGEIEPMPWDEWAAYFGTDNDELHVPFNFELIHTKWSAAAVRSVVDSVEAALPAGAWPNYVLGNHDQRRLATRVGDAQARIAAMLLLTLRGTPTLYYGDEVGMHQMSIAAEQQQDPYGRRFPGEGRDGCRTPMQWEDSVTAGFSEAAPEDLWLPINADVATTNVASQLEDSGSILSLYRHLLALRRSSNALRAGAYVAIDSPEQVFAYKRRAGNEEYVIALNFSDAAATVSLPAGEIAAATHPDRSGRVDGPAELAPDEGIVVAVAGSH